jgi:cell wall-associated NlpC family hydrolase
MTPADFIAAARSYVGVPFRHQGRTRHGVDCIGLVVCAARDIGLTLADRTDYPRDPNGLLQLEMARQFAPVESTQAGDILLMRFRGEPQHVAILAGATLIHGYASIGRVVEHGLDAKWRRRIVATYRLKEFA